MSIAVRTGARSGLGVSLPALSTTEAQALEVPGLAWRFSARDLDPSARGLAYRDGVGGGLFASQGGAGHGSVGTPARPALRLGGGANDMLIGPVTIPASYTVYSLVTPNANALQTLVASRSTDGARAWMVSDAARNVRLIHGSDEIISSQAYVAGQPYVAIWGYDRPSTTGAVGLNTATSFVTGTMAPHKGEAFTAIGGILSGGAGSTTLNGYEEEVWCFEGSHLLSGLERYVQTVAAFLAARAGVTLT